jgi:hypothetical protein
VEAVGREGKENACHDARPSLAREMPRQQIGPKSGEHKRKKDGRIEAGDRPRQQNDRHHQ